MSTTIPPGRTPRHRRVVAAGTPEEVTATPGFYTGAFYTGAFLARTTLAPRLEDEKRRA